MLWDDDRSLMLVGDGQSAWGNQRFRLNVVLLHARTGVATGRELASPGVESSDETEGIRRRSVASAFDRGGISAIEYAPGSGVIAACSLPQPGLPPPAVIVWDWDSGAP